MPLKICYAFYSYCYIIDVFFSGRFAVFNIYFIMHCILLIETRVRDVNYGTPVLRETTQMASCKCTKSFPVQLLYEVMAVMWSMLSISCTSVRGTSLRPCYCWWGNPPLCLPHTPWWDTSIKVTDGVHILFIEYRYSHFE